MTTTLTRTTVRTLAAALAVLGLVATSCGDDGEATEPPPSTGDAAPDGSTTTVGEDADAAAAIGLDLDECPESYDPAEGVSQTEILIGQSVPKSGPAATYALLTAGMKGYFAYANAELDGVNGRQLRLLDLDDAYEPARTAQNIDELLDEGVFATAGILGTPQNLAVRDTLNEECVPHLFPSTGAAEWGNAEEYPWTVDGAVIPYNVEARAWAEYLTETFPDGAEVVALQMDNEFGKEYEAWLRHYLEGTDVELTSVVTHAPTAPDIRNQMTTLAATEADVAIAMTTASYCTQFMAAFEGSSWQPTRLISGTCKTGILFAGAGDGAIDSLILAASKEITDGSYDADPEVAAIRDALATYAPDAPASVSLVGIGWLFGETLRDVLLRAEDLPGGLTRPNTVIAARQTDYQPAMLYDGIRLKLDGLDDTYLVEAGRIEKWNGTSFEKVTDIYDYEGETEPTFD